MKKYIFVALAAICLSVLFSCSSRVPVVNNKDTYTIDTADNIDTKETYQIDTEDNPVTEDVSVNETNFDTEVSADPIDPNAVGGETFDQLKLKFSPPLGVIGGKPGDRNFYITRIDDVTRVIAKFEKEYPYPCLLYTSRFAVGWQKAGFYNTGTAGGRIPPVINMCFCLVIYVIMHFWNLEITFV